MEVTEVLDRIHIELVFLLYTQLALVVIALGNFLWRVNGDKR